MIIDILHRIHMLGSTPPVFWDFCLKINASFEFNTGLRKIYGPPPQTSYRKDAASFDPSFNRLSVNISTKTGPSRLVAV